MIFDIIMLHINKILLHVYINKSPVNIFMLHANIIYLARRGQNYATTGYPNIRGQTVGLLIRYTFCGHWKTKLLKQA